ncbi:mediator of RNA polymerase II transcription subunit 15a-like [Populus alba x Populus x berolinensis]|nr:mediator of RNA polymerase II transcription subunit 15a-like [Populus alba x Populus x berolinensis]
MKKTYFPEINEMYQRIAAKLQQLDSLPQQPKSEQLEKLMVFKAMLERLITFLQVSKNNITPGFKEKLGSYEKQIVSFLKPSRFRRGDKHGQDSRLEDSTTAEQRQRSREEEGRAAVFDFLRLSIT